MLVGAREAQVIVNDSVGHDLECMQVQRGVAAALEQAWESELGPVQWGNSYFHNLVTRLLGGLE